MTNISVRKEAAVRPTTSNDWDPNQMIQRFFGWDPFREISPMMAEDRYGFAPAFDIKETKDAYLFKADLPGVKESDLEVSMTGNRLTVSGKREAEKREQSDRYYAYERSYGSFTRSFTLPDGTNADAVHAEMKDGVLTLSVPKKPEMQPKKIAVKAGTPKS